MSLDERTSETDEQLSLDEALLSARRRYVERRPISQALGEQAGEVMPGGHTRTVLHFDPFPFRVTYGSGSEITDADGHRYVDLLGNYTAGLLGHSPAPVRAAITAALERGWSFGATHPDEIAFARLVVDRFPSIEQVRFTNSGTEANLLAIAAAKHVTSRSKVLGFEGGYHGGVLYFGAHREANVPHEYVIVPYNNVEALGRAFVDHPDLACTLIEPMQGSAGCIPAEQDFLVRLRELCDTHGTVLIFDEVMTSRLSPGGLQQAIGVLPDVTTLGKYLGGGTTFGAFGGKRTIMAAYDHTAPHPLGHTGTFNNNVLTMAAGIATLTEVLTDDVLTRTNERGESLRARLSAVFVQHELPMSVTGRGSLMNIHATNRPIANARDLAGSDDRCARAVVLRRDRQRLLLCPPRVHRVVDRSDRRTDRPLLCLRRALGATSGLALEVGGGRGAEVPAEVAGQMRLVGVAEFRSNRCPARPVAARFCRRHGRLRPPR